MCTTHTQCLDFKGLELVKYKQFQSKKETIFIWFNSFSTSMVSCATGVLPKSICKYRRDLESQGLLFKGAKKIGNQKVSSLIFIYKLRFAPKVQP